jgi:hypothetical protein
MTPEESDARLRRIYEDWRRWCEANRGNGIRRVDDGTGRQPLAKRAHVNDLQPAKDDRDEGATP